MNHTHIAGDYDGEIVQQRLVLVNIGFFAYGYSLGAEIWPYIESRLFVEALYLLFLGNSFFSSDPCRNTSRGSHRGATMVANVIDPNENSFERTAAWLSRERFP